VNEEMTWITQAQLGNDEAFTCLVEHYQTPVFNMCFRMLGEAEAAEDAAQESFLRAYQNLGMYDRQRPFATWLLSIAAHYCIDKLRRKRFNIFSIDQESEDDDRPIEIADTAAENPEHESIRHQEQEEIQKVLSKLEHTDRAAIILRYWYDFSEVEIAASLNLTVSAVKSRLHRARRSIAKIMMNNPAEENYERKPYGSQLI